MSWQNQRETGTRNGFKTSPRAQSLRWVKASNPQNINPAIGGIIWLATLSRLDLEPN